MADGTDLKHTNWFFANDDLKRFSQKLQRLPASSI